MRAVFVGGKYHGQLLEMDVVEHLEDVYGRTADWTAERMAGMLVHRAELDNQPKVKGYAGPMWDGDRLRYESSEVYRMMSI